MVRAHFNGDRECKLYNPPSNRDRSLRNATDCLLYHEERCQQKQINIMVPARYLYLIYQFCGKKLLHGVQVGSSTGESGLKSKAQVVIYSKPGCHLCDEAKASIREARCDDKFTLVEINIETDPELMAKYRYDIPVIAIDGVDTFMHRVYPEEFRARILLSLNEK